MVAQQQQRRPQPAPDDVRELNARIAHTSRVITLLYERTRRTVEAHDNLIARRDALLDRRDAAYHNIINDEDGAHAQALVEALTGDAPLDVKLANGMRIVSDADFADNPYEPTLGVGIGGPGLILQTVDLDGDAIYRCADCNRFCAWDGFGEQSPFCEICHPKHQLEPDPDFAAQLVRESTQETAEILAAARAQDPDCAAAPLTQTEIAAEIERRKLPFAVLRAMDAAATRRPGDPALYDLTCADCGKDFRAAVIARHCPACIAAAYQRESGDRDDLNEHDAGGNA